MKRISLVASGVLVSGLLVVGAAPAANAATDTEYSCSGLGGSTPTSALNSVTPSTPTSMVVGDSAPVGLTSALSLPSGLLGTALGLVSSVTGTGTTTGTIVGPQGFTTQTIPGLPTALPAGIKLPTSGSLSLPLSSGSTQFAPTIPGTYSILAGSDTASLNTLLGGVLPLNCVPGANDVLGTIDVSSAPPVPGLNDSTTTLKLTRLTEAYGQANKATATVTTGALGQLAQGGTVTFKVTGRADKAVPLGSDGTATISLPRLTAGHTYSVNASFTSSQPLLVAPSDASRQVLKVVKDKTTTRVAAPDIRKKHHATAAIRVVSAHHAGVVGKVRVMLKRGKHTVSSRTVKLVKGAAHVRFGVVRKRGKNYGVVAKYLPTQNFRTSWHRDGFVVR